MEDRPINTQRRASGRGGWVALLSGESQGRAIQRAIADINGEGYRIVFVIEDKPSFLWKLFNSLIFFCTIGFYSRVPGMLIIGERID